jgi:hypothetical protein
MTGAVFTPSGGSILESEPGTSVDFTFTAPNEEEKSYAGSIKVINVGNPSDLCDMPTTLTTPRARNIQNTMFLRLLQQFPNAFPILRIILGM